MRVLVLVAATVGLLAPGPVAAQECPAGQPFADHCHVWWASFHDGANATDSGQAVSFSPDGSTLFVAANIYGSESRSADIGVVAYDTHGGDVRWSTVIDGSKGGVDRVAAMGVAPDGSRVYVAGTVAGGTDSSLVALDAAAGDRLWWKSLSGDDVDDVAATSLAVTAYGTADRVYVGGFGVSDASQQTDGVVMAFSGPDGTRAWLSRIAGAGHSDEQVNSVAVDGSGTKVVAVGGTGQGVGDFLSVALDAGAGTEQWRQTYDGPGSGNDEAAAVAASGSRVFVTGPSVGSGSGSDYATVAYSSADGSLLWAARYMDVPVNPAAAAVDDVPRAIAAGTDTVFVTGTGGGDYLTIAYDAADGTVRWDAAYDSPHHRRDTAYAMALAPDGERLYVTGNSGYSGLSVGAGGGGQNFGFVLDDYATVAYAAGTGDRLWTARYDGAGGQSDSAFAVAVSPTGDEIAVTGSAFSASQPNAGVPVMTGTGVDVVTLRYPR